MEQKGRPGLSETLVVWGLFALFALAVFATYTRLPARELYNVSGSGPEAGFSRALLFVGFPFAIVAVALAAIAAGRLATRSATALAALAVVLCATVGLPGVIDQADLDAKPVNALAGVGAAIVLALTVWALLREGIGSTRPCGRGDVVRIVLGVLLVLAALPWIFAELGYYVSDAPLLGRIFLAGELKPPTGGEPSLRAVHLGHHHGMDGTLLGLSALVLSRVPGQIASRRLAAGLAAYLALMFSYGVANALQDFWTEQLVKRGTLSATIPNVLRPSLSPAWAGIVLGAVAIYFAVSRVGRVNRLQGRNR
ncbi:MAG: hypothetical protein ABI649_07155 [Gaiellaceae bacterium]